VDHVHRDTHGFRVVYATETSQGCAARALGDDQHVHRDAPLRGHDHGIDVELSDEISEFDGEDGEAGNGTRAT